MFITTDFKTQSTDFSELFSAIDNKLYTIAKNKLNNNRLGMTNKINYDAFEDLVEYREILKDLQYCSQCLADVNRSVIISNIRKLTNTIC